MKYCNSCKKIKTFENFHKSKAQKDGYVSLCKICKSNYRKLYYIKNKEKELNNNLEYRNKNKEFIKKINKNYYKNNFNKIALYKQNWAKENREKINKKHQRRNKSDQIYRLKRALRSRFAQAFKKGYKGGIAVKYLGCSIEEFKLYLESKFEPGMNWNNYGLKGWHIDHIIPLSLFDLNNKNDIMKACHYTNLQPMWAKANLSKGNRI